MVLCSTKKMGYGKTETLDPIRRAGTQWDPGLGTPHVIPETQHPGPKYLFSSKYDCDSTVHWQRGKEKE